MIMGKWKMKHYFLMEYNEFGRGWKALLNELHGVDGAGKWKFVRAETGCKRHC